MRRSGLLATASIASVLALALAATALAAHPRAGRKYTGFTSARRVNGFGAPVSFKVSSDRTKLLGFKYATLGCFGAGGFGRGNPYKTFAGTIQKVGTIPVTATGSFSVSGARSTFKNRQGIKTVTTSSVTGRFTTSKKAAGSIKFTQEVSGPHIPSQRCGPVTVTFTAKTR